ncbi:MAG: hypothetical protein QM498_10265 [Desulfobacterium sp.]
MSHPNQKIVQNTVYPPVSRIALTVGTVGAIVGGTNAAAKNIRKVNNNEINKETAVKEVFKEAAGVGVAIGAATAVVKTVTPRSNILGIVGIIAVATGTKMLWDSATGKKENSAQKNSPTDEVTAAQEKSSTTEEATIQKKSTPDKETTKPGKTEKKATK